MSDVLNLFKVRLEESGLSIENFTRLLFWDSPGLSDEDLAHRLQPEAFARVFLNKQRHDFLVQQANCALEKGDLKMAHRLIKRLEELSPKHPETVAAVLTLSMMEA